MGVFKYFIITGLLVATMSANASQFVLENGYFRVSGEDGVVTSLRFDPAGKGLYGRNHIISLSVGNPVRDPNAKPEVDNSEHRLIIRSAKFTNPIKVDQSQANFAQLCAPGTTIGQTFTIEHGFLQSVEAHIPTWHTTNSSATLTLYRLEGNKKTRIASQRYENLVDGMWVELKAPDAPAGTFLLEMSDVKGMAGWWSLGKDVVKGEAQVDGQPKPNEDRCFRVHGYEIGIGDFEIMLDGNRMHTRFVPARHADFDDGLSLSKDAIQTHIVFPWVKSGYDTTGERIVFHHFLTSDGLYMPVHQFKRRPWSGVSGAWVLMSGRFGSDLKFPNASIHLRFDEDSMTMVFPGGEREIELLPHSDELGEQFPVFYSSNPKIDKVLNEFLLSHNFNFGVGTNPDWKDWHTLQLSWTANRQCIWQRRQFLDFKIDSDGYVYCWGSDPGWPFPYKDEDNDGRNDYDTRHFTSNPCFILGAWREYCWNPDPEYLAKLMPRVRLAMEFMLKEMDGDKGILIAKAPGHEGKDKCIGSNYWDISPFGWKDAFTNAYYYPCLEAMAQLEEACIRYQTLGSLGEKEMGGNENEEIAIAPRTPYYYRRLAEIVRKSYNETFWLDDKGRYSGCVDIDGVTHDYGFTYVNLTAMAHGLADPDRVRRIYEWMENGISSSGKRDIYSRWVFAPRACSIHIPRRDEPQDPVPSWWSMAWNGTAYDEQCQDGGAILYTSFYDILARARYLGADNAWKRLMEILKRYSEPDHLSGGSPLYRGEVTQGGPGGTAGSVGVEGEFPESGLVPVSFLYAFLGIDADIHGLKIKPNLPSALRFAGVRNLRYNGLMYDIRVTNNADPVKRTHRDDFLRWFIEIKCITKGCERVVRTCVRHGETFVFKG